MAKRTRARSVSIADANAAVLPHVQAAAGRGIVIQITGDGESAKRALEMVQEKLNQTSDASERTERATRRVHGSMEEGVPKMAAASAGLRALEGNFTNNIRAGERFLTLIPGMADALQAAFPAVGAVVLATALVRLGAEAYHAYENIVLLKKATEDLNQLDITVAKRVQSVADEQEASLEQRLERTLGKAAALKQKYAYQSGKGIDLGDELFYQQQFKDLPTNVKANYETLYKAVAPQDIPNRLQRIKQELKDLHGALDLVNSGTTGAFVPNVNGYGPKTYEDPTKYYEARIKAATDVQKLLTAEAARRGSLLQDIQDEHDHPKGKEGPNTANAVAEARQQLADEAARVALAHQKAAGQVRLAEWDAQHRMQLEGDQSYLSEKLKIQTEELDAEEAALNQRQANLQKLLERQQGDSRLKRDGGESAEELRTKKELLKVEGDRDQLAAKRAQVGADNAVAVDAMNRAADLAHLKVAAELEQQRNTGIAAQIALIRQQHEEEAKRNTNAGGSEEDAAAIRSTGEVLVQKLQLADASRVVRDIEADYARQIELVNLKVRTGHESQRAGQRDIQVLREKELADLQKQAALIDEMAAKLGGEYTQQAAAFHSKLTELGTHDRTQDGDYKFAQDLKGLTEGIAQSATNASQSFSQMALSILNDIDRMALKMTEKTFIEPLFDGFGGGGAGGQGGGGGNPFKALGSALGFWKAPQAAQSGGGAGSMVAGIAQAAAGRLTPSITTNLHNNSSQPLQGGDPTVRYDDQLGQFVLDFILNDHATGGQIRQLYGQG